jgi:hypothetical protein
MTVRRIMAKLVNYVQVDGEKTYNNLGIQLDSGFVIPIRTIVKKHYYQLLQVSEDVKIEYKKKGE